MNAHRSGVRNRTHLAGIALAALGWLAGTAAAAPPLVTFAKTSGWDGGFGGEIRITNRGTASIADWQLQYDGGPAITGIWNGTMSTANGHVTIVNAGWNGTIAVGATVTIGLNGSGTLNENVSNCSVNGVAAEIAYSGSSGGSGGGGGGSGGGGSGGGTGDLTIPHGPFDCFTDLNGDGATDGGDLGALLAAWGPAAANAPADFDRNGTVDGADMAVLLGRWGACPEPKRIVGYWIEWGIYGRNYQPADTPFHKVTHLNYAFANVDATYHVVPYDSYAAIDKAYPGDTWNQPVRGAYNQLNNVLKKQYPHLKTLISVGGWTLSARFSDAALTPANRTTFADSCVAFIRQYGFDGVDIDWEYPGGGGLDGNVARPEDKRNFTLLLQAVRQKLDAAGTADGTRYLLTIAAPAGYDKIANIEPAAIAATVDWVNVMNYDYFGAWDPSFTANHAPLRANPAMPAGPQLASQYNVASSIGQYLAAGVPAQQLVMGLPAYGRSWRGVPAANDGLFQPGTGPAPGTWDDWSSGVTGVNDFTQIRNVFMAPGSGYVRHWDAVSQSPWLYNPNAYGGHFIGFDDEESVGLKIDWANDHGLGGAMMWDFTGDRDGVILDAIGAGLGARPFR